MDNSNGDVEMTSKPSSSGKDNKGVAQTQKVSREQEEEEDRPPTPPKRDFKAEDKDIVNEPEVKRRRILSFPRPEVIYKPENSESLMSCLKNTVILLNLLIWLFGAVLTGIGIWIKVDEDFWNIQTGLDMKQFSTSAYILIAVGVLIMLIGFAGCYGAYALSMCFLIVHAVVLIILILLEIAVMALVWSAISNKDLAEDIKAKSRKALQEMASEDHQRQLLDLIQTKLECCGIDGPDDYTDSASIGIPPSCSDVKTGYPYKQGCLEAVIKYLKSKAGILGGLAAGTFILELAILILTFCLICAIKNSASNSIF